MKVKNISGGPMDFRNYPLGMLTRKPDEVFDLKKEIADRLLASEIPLIEKYDPEKDEQAANGSQGPGPSALIATIYPIADDDKHFDVVLAEGEADEDPQTITGQTQEEVDALLVQKKLDPKNDKQVIRAEEPLEDPAEGNESLKATIYPIKDDPKHFTVVLIDEDGPEVHEEQTQKEVDALLKELELDPKNADEVVFESEPYAAPETNE